MFMSRGRQKFDELTASGAAPQGIDVDADGRRVASEDEVKNLKSDVRPSSERSERIRINTAGSGTSVVRTTRRRCCISKCVLAGSSRVGYGPEPDAR